MEWNQFRKITSRYSLCVLTFKIDVKHPVVFLSKLNYWSARRAQNTRQLPGCRYISKSYKYVLFILFITHTHTLTMEEGRRVEQMKAVQAEALELFTRKNADYGDAFAKYGVIGVLMRIEDKLQRSMSITKNGVNLVSDEGIRDTLIDLHNYAAMALMLLDE